MTAADRVEEIRALYTSDGLTFAFGWRDAIRDLLTALDAERERAKAAVAKLGMTLGVGDGSGQLFVHGDHASIKECQRKLLALATAERECEALREALRKISLLATNPLTSGDHYLERLKAIAHHAALAPGNAPVKMTEIDSAGVRGAASEARREIAGRFAPTAPAGPSEEAMEVAHKLVAVLSVLMRGDLPTDASIRGIARALDALAGRVKP